MGKLKTVYKNLSLKKALTLTIVVSLFIAFSGAMAILLATRPSYYALVAENSENPAMYWHDFFSISTVGIYVCVVIIVGSYIFYRFKLFPPLKAWRMTEEHRKLNAAFAHDLRTPLTVLQGYAILICEELAAQYKNKQNRDTISRRFS